MGWEALLTLAVVAACFFMIALSRVSPDIIMAASASFATPIGSQTNLMVYNAGGYRFADFMRIGLPLTLLVGLVTVGLVPVIWQF